MRSLIWRWSVAVVVGSLWGALISPSRLHTAGEVPKSPKAYLSLGNTQ
jgi:hypothetical protein